MTSVSELVERLQKRIADNRRVGNVGCCVNLADLEEVVAALTDTGEEPSDKAVEAGWVVMSKAFGRDVPDRTVRAFYKAMRQAELRAALVGGAKPVS